VMMVPYMFMGFDCGPKMDFMWNQCSARKESGCVCKYQKESGVRDGWKEA
jgi:hypothetical protein